MKGRFERFDLLDQRIRNLLRGRRRHAGNVVNRFLGIKLRTLAAGPGQDIDDVALQIEKPELEDGEKTGWPGADDGDIGFMMRPGLCYVRHAMTHFVVLSVVEVMRRAFPSSRWQHNTDLIEILMRVFVKYT